MSLTSFWQLEFCGNCLRVFAWMRAPTFSLYVLFLREKLRGMVQQ